MKLEVTPPFAAMEALSVDEVPNGPGWQYEPKWDGFRCLAFRDGDQVELQSKSGQPLSRYFPEIVDGLRALKPSRFALDGELVIPSDGALSFDDLLQRLHPAESRVHKLAAQTPALLSPINRASAPACKRTKRFARPSVSAVDFATRRRSRSPICLGPWASSRKADVQRLMAGFCSTLSVPGSAARPPNS